MAPQGRYRRHSAPPVAPDVPLARLGPCRRTGQSPRTLEWLGAALLVAAAAATWFGSRGQRQALAPGLAAAGLVAGVAGGCLEAQAAEVASAERRAAELERRVRALEVSVGARRGGAGGPPGRQPAGVGG